MKIKKSLFLLPLGALLSLIALPTHAESIYGKVGYRADGGRILIAYKDYGRNYRDQHYGHKKYKHKYHHYKRGYGKPYYRGYDRRYKQRVYRDPYNSYRSRGRYCPRY